MNKSIKLHDNEVDITIDIVRRLIEEQFPQYSELPITLGSSSGTNNVIFRLGKDKCLRMPRTKDAETHLQTEIEWLPKLAPHISVKIPEPIALGKQSDEYPYTWAIYNWIDGSLPSEDTRLNKAQLAEDLARFIKEFQSVNLDNAKPAKRGKPIRQRDGEMQNIWPQVEDLVDVQACKKIWQEVVGADDWRGNPVWIHGDIMDSNLVVRDGKLAGILDFSGIGVGDPAVDYMIAWELFDTDSRTVFEQTANVDPATWTRAKGWALSTALIALPYYLNKNPAMTKTSRTKINNLIAELY